MLKKVLILVIISVISHQIYLSCYEHYNGKIERFQKDEKENTNKYQFNPNVQSEFVHPTLGKPNKIINNEYQYFYSNPLPWNTVIYNPHVVYNYRFIAQINDIKLDLTDWKQVIPNLEYVNNVLTIPSNDEESALAILNLILNHSMKNITFQHIVENNLIPISIQKAQKYPVVKNKLKDQIIENLNNIKDFNINKTSCNTDSIENIDLDYKEDLATNNCKDQNNDLGKPMAYEGGEFYFIG